MKLAAEDVLTSLGISAPAPISPAKEPVHFSPVKSTLAELKMSAPDESLKAESRFKLSQSSDNTEVYLAAARQKATQSAPDIIFSNYSCAICLCIVEDGVHVRGLPCGHAFHVDCVDKWLLWRRPYCPLCKMPYQKNLAEA
jgi:hypothetical protein